MRNIIKALGKVPKQVYALVAVATAVVAVSSATFAWGPSRPTYTIDHPADHPTFNSITDNPVQGDERNFVQVKDASAANSTYTDSQQLTPGKTYTMFMYYHNDAASNLNASGQGLAKDVTAKAELPAIVASGATNTQAVGFINSSNASPKSVWDEVSFSNKSGGDIALRYVPGSATIHNQGNTNGMKLSDGIVTSGAELGFDSLNGVVPGCNHYAGYVTFNFVADQANFTVNKQVRKTGTTAWSKNIAVNPGDSVDYLISYNNTGSTAQDNVIIKDQLPAGETYVAGSAKLADPKYPSGVKTDDGVTTTGLNIGNYPAGSNAFLIFTTKIASGDQLKCGPNTLVNKATVDTDNGDKSSTATVTVNGKDCAQPIQVCDLKTQTLVTIDESQFDSSLYSKNLADCNQTPTTPTTPTTPEASLLLPHTGPADTLAKLFGAVSLASTFAYYVASRRNLN